MDKILPDGSVQGKTFSGDNYNGKYPTQKEGQTYKEYYELVEECKKNGFHLGDLSWSDYYDYIYGSPAGGGQYIQNYVMGEVPDDVWEYEDDEDDEEF